MAQLPTAVGSCATQGVEAPPLCSKVALADSVEDPLEAPPLCSKVALADSVEDPLEAPPLCSKAALADTVEEPLGGEASRLEESLLFDLGQPLHFASSSSEAKQYGEKNSEPVPFIFTLENLHCEISVMA